MQATYHFFLGNLKLDFFFSITNIHHKSNEYACWQIINCFNHNVILITAVIFAVGIRVYILITTKYKRSFGQLHFMVRRTLFNTTTRKFLFSV